MKAENLFFIKYILVVICYQELRFAGMKKKKKKSNVVVFF